MTKLPYVTINAAMTVDGKTDTFARRGAPISSTSDWMRVDQLRASSDAIMVGGHTLLGDDPRLVIKSDALRAARITAGKDENPIKVGVVTKADLEPDCCFINSGVARKIIFTTTQTSAEKIAELTNLGVEVHVEGSQRVDLRVALEHLAATGVEKLLVEGGGILIEELLKARLVNEILVCIAPLIFCGASSPTLANSSGFERDQAVSLTLKSMEQFEDGGILLRYTL